MRACHSLSRCNGLCSAFEHKLYVWHRNQTKSVASVPLMIYLALRAEMQIIFWGQCSQYKGKIGITAIAILAMKGTALKNIGMTGKK